MSVQKEDVYETDDVPIPEETEQEEQFEDEAVEKIHVDVDGAIKLFGNRLLNADGVDFSDAIANHRKKRGYRSGHYVLEMLGAENEDKETTEQKFRRLRCEVEELMETVSREKENEQWTASISKAELNDLNDVLKAAVLKKMSVGEQVVEPSTFDKAKEAEVIGKGTEKSKDVKALDERIRRIEQAVVGQGKLNRSSYEPLIETLENLRLQVDSLNPAYLDGISSHLNTAMQKLTELDDKRSKVQSEEMEQKVDKLYQLITQWDVTCANVPSIVKRLQSLSKLHEQAQEFSSKLNDVCELKQHLEKKTENHKVMLFELKRETTKFVNELTSKIEDLQQRVSSLQK